jgi:hypothetical protein
VRTLGAADHFAGARERAVAVSRPVRSEGIYFERPDRAPVIARQARRVNRGGGDGRGQLAA